MKEKAKATDTAKAEVVASGGEAEQYLAEMQSTAKSEKKAQRRVLAAWSIKGKEGQRVLVVQPNGSHKIEEK